MDPKVKDKTGGKKKPKKMISMEVKDEIIAKHERGVRSKRRNDITSDEERDSDCYSSERRRPLGTTGSTKNYRREEDREKLL
ncbi:hypothetical protein NPIL_279081 [Nephila pilipes]|uniref:Uncharacterized protein n=1 Tax=Nephila pilipes TaxID=299642 RepID=A0A8X6MEE7_NEPPI|nr:hypothetical protein NPIL_279081 [Nephila pilipes]